MSRKLVGLRNTAVLVVLGAAVVWAVNCGPPPDGADSGIDPAAQRRLLESLANGVMVPTHRRFLASAEQLEAAAQAHATSLSDADRAAAQQAWRDAMAEWQRAELMQIGPSAPASDPGGQSLRDEIYSFPSINRCRIDQETVEGAFTDPDAFAAELVDARGLAAMEYLLFVETDENACLGTNPINAEGQWAALGPAEIARRRAAYAGTLAILVRRSAEALVSAWDPAGGDFVSQLVDPGPGRLYASPGAALNAVTDAMFYLDLVTKDRKVAAPLGLRDCAATACPELVESPLASTSTENIANNLRAFEELFLGAAPGVEGYGLDDLLVSVGEEALADRMRTHLEAAIASADSFDPSLADAVTSDRESALALHAAIRLVTDDLKGPFTTSLHLTVPNEAGGDTD